MAGFTHLELVIYGLVNFLTAIFSGMTGGGGGFINTPLLIFLGLSPAQAVATGKFAGLSVSLGSLEGLRGVKRGSKKQLAAIMLLALVIGLLAPLVIVRLDNDFYRKFLGALLLLMIPVLIIKKVGRVETRPSSSKKAIGVVLLTLSLSLQAVFSGGMGTLVNIVLMAFLGMGALEASVTKRYSQLILNGIIILGVFWSGLIIWPVALTSAVTAGLGGFIGGRIATKKGNSFVMTVFMVLMFISALELLFG